jgi:hypothetical protein
LPALIETKHSAHFRPVCQRLGMLSDVVLLYGGIAASARSTRTVAQMLFSCCGTATPNFSRCYLTFRPFLLYRLSCRIGRPRQEEREPGRLPLRTELSEILSKRVVHLEFKRPETPSGLNDVRPCTASARASSIDQQQVNARTRASPWASRCQPPDGPVFMANRSG